MEDDLFFRVNKRLGTLSMEMLSRNHQIEEFVNALLLDRLPRDRCAVCDGCIGCDNEEKEGHHPAKKGQYPLVVSLCVRCHRPLTEEQKLWDRRCWEPDQPENIRKASMLYGLRDICIRRGRVLGDPAYQVFADMLRDDIGRLLKGDKNGGS